ncbi:hypothetical protein [Nocardioides insulae]|uniref:hypothetical protein n=1 Tax=Nocardioides insulae TaxID=394734 RepID=UPI000421A5C0|nr:hypothetical protein [Nocardioides insulae]
MKKLVLVVAVLFVGFWLFTDPRGLADLTEQAIVAATVGVGALFEAVIGFIGNLA